MFFLQCKTIIYSDYDHNGWITRIGLSNDWDPLVFFICANVKKCVVCIQVDETEEYRIYPWKKSGSLVIKFGQLEKSKFVYLSSDNNKTGNCKVNVF